MTAAGMGVRQSAGMGWKTERADSLLVQEQITFLGSL